MKYTNIIERYFFGELYNEELISFENELSKNDELKKEFVLYKSIFDSLEEIPLTGDIDQAASQNFEPDQEIVSLIEKYSSHNSFSEDELDLIKKIRDKKQDYENDTDKDHFSPN